MSRIEAILSLLTAHSGFVSNAGLLSALSFLGSTAVLPHLDVQKRLPSQMRLHLWLIRASCCKKKPCLFPCCMLHETWVPDNCKKYWYKYSYDVPNISSVPFFALYCSIITAITGCAVQIRIHRAAMTDLRNSIMPMLTLRINQITKIFVRRYLFANHQDLNLVRKYLFHMFGIICLEELQTI